jgi:hypothetical protein
VKLRRHGNIYHVHFALNGEFWRKSTCTSDQRIARSRAEEIVRQARAGDIQRTYDPVERSARIAETRKRSWNDPKTQRAHKAPWTRKKRNAWGREKKKEMADPTVRRSISDGTNAALDKKRKELGEDEFHRRASERATKTWERSDYRNKQISERKKRGRSRKFREQMRAQTIALHRTEEFRTAIAEGQEKSSVRRLLAKGWIIAPGGVLAPPGTKRPGPHRVTKVDYHQAMTLRDQDSAVWSWGRIAKELDPEKWAKGGKSRKAAADRIRVNVGRLKKNLKLPPRIDAPQFLGGDK